MATFPSFVVPHDKSQTAFESHSTNARRREQPHLQLHTSIEAGEGHSLDIPGRRCSRPPPVRTSLTPPYSPTRTRSSTVGSQDPWSRHDDGAITPPVTPTNASHSKTNSASSDPLNALSSLRRGDSTSSQTRSRSSIDKAAKPSSTHLRTFPYHLTDYEFLPDGEGKNKILGEGLWSDVYLAEPSLSNPTQQPFSAAPFVRAATTPPTTPVHSRSAGVGGNQLPAIPCFYAIKSPASTSANKVLESEAHILSYLSRLPDAERHIVPFFGLDTRSGALVLQAMEHTLESWIENELNTLDAAARAHKLAAIFPAVATSLLDSLLWMQDHACTHADIKPSNMLVARCAPPTLHVVFSDFSSSILTRPAADTSGETSPFGAGTWDYLDAALLSSAAPACPSAVTDLWSLAITLLVLVLGASPYDAFKANKFQQREMIKSGSPLQCLGYGDEGVRNVKRLNALSADLGFDVQKWFAKVLVKDREKRVGVGEWKEELERAM